MYCPPPVALVALVLVAGLALLGGCAQFDWHKADVTLEARDRDIADCTAQARRDALRHAPVLQPPGPRILVDRQGSIHALQPPRHDDARFLVEQDILRACMRARGYDMQNRPTAP